MAGHLLHACENLAAGMEVDVPESAISSGFAANFSSVTARQHL